ncbi:MAG: OB-fold domain-containing protein [Dehalococcoidia bacterium]
MAESETQTAEKTEKPIVPFLRLPEKQGEKAYLLGTKCTACGAAYVGDRLACGKCCAVGGFEPVKFSDHGTLHTFSIVYQTAPGIPVPFVAAIIDLPEGTSIRANIEGIEPDPDKLVPLLGKRVDMYTEKVRTDREGNDVIAFKFRPAQA